MASFFEARILVLFGSFVVMSFVIQEGKALIALHTGCPEIKSSENGTMGVCANTCTHLLDCKDTKEWCCPNSCGGKQCMLVKASCQEDGIEYNHHSVMPYHTDDPEICASCWCQNGEKQCYEYPCTGPVP